MEYLKVFMVFIIVLNQALQVNFIPALKKEIRCGIVSFILDFNWLVFPFFKHLNHPQPSSSSSSFRKTAEE